MQGKGLIRFFLIFMLILSVYTFALFLPTNTVENRADVYATQLVDRLEEGPAKDFERDKARQEYLDSISNKTVLNLGFRKFTYMDLKKSQLALGLDLQGGMSVVMQVDVKDMIVQLADGNQDINFRKALATATERQANSQSDYITLFVNAFNEIAPNQKLAPIFQNSLRDEINFDTRNGEVASILREKANDKVEITFKQLKQRVDKLGVTQPNVSLDEGTDRIIIELPGVKNPKRVEEYLTVAAKLEFFDVYLGSEIYQRLATANQQLKQREDALKSQEKKDTTGTNVSTDEPVINPDDSLGNVEDSLQSQISNAGPLFSKLRAFPNQFAEIGQALVRDTAEVNKLLRSPLVSMPRDLKFLWADKVVSQEDNQEELITLYAVKTVNGGFAPMEGDVVTGAQPDLDPESNSYTVSIKMNSTGRQIWSRMTTAAAPTKKQIVIALDDQVVSAPAVQNPITGGNTQITGNFTPQEAQDLANVLQVGKLEADLQIIEKAIVGPTLGAKNIRSSLTALAFGMIVLLAFMIFYYSSGGIVSIIALLLNLLFVVATLASLGTVLTLPGIAGLILTIGMAVDANVIIYERIREELREGKALKTAIADGFRASYSAIIDANVTTILTAIVLFWFGLGPIKGFAAVLMIGVISSLFTAVAVGRLMIEAWLGRGRSIAFSTKMTESAFANLNFDFIKARRTSYMVSGVIILAGLISFFTLGFQQGVDFKGGYSYAVQFEKPVDAETIRNTMGGADIFEKTPIVKEFGGNNTYEITTDYMIDVQEQNADSIVLNRLHAGVEKIVGAEIDIDGFILGSTNTRLTRTIKVGPTIADDITKSAFYSAIFALLLIFLYIFIRFRKWQYSLGAVAALFHDVLIVLTAFSLGSAFLPFPVEIDQVFIGAILTVIGYSINDTVVVFDRIREFVNAYTRKDKKEVFNLAVNNTISRTIITSLTTLFVVLVLFLFGGGSIKGFAFALLVGILVGTYSSVFIATPIVYDLTGEMSPKEVGKKTKYGGRSISKNEPLDTNV